MAKFETEIEIDDIPVEVVVGYDYEPPCGDGWDEPRMAEDVCIYSVVDKAGAEVDYTPEQEAWLIDEILDDLHLRAAEYAADKAEYFYESMMDRRML